MENKQNGCTNRHPCQCASTGCARHGKCCECVAYHKKQGNLPACLNKPAGK